MEPSFRSFFWGGFESATHRRRDGFRVDASASSRHDVCCAEDYSLLQLAGVRTVRDALRWHRIETWPGDYDWTSLTAMLEAAHATDTQLLLDLCHWGLPDWVDPFSDEFIERFCAFAQGAATILRDFHRDHALAPPMVCPVNEISFWSWVGGDEAYFYPLGRGRGPQLKRQLARAANAAILAMRTVCPDLGVIQPEPVIHIAADPARPEEEADVQRHNASQFEAWDMLLGRCCPELGGSEDHIDCIGVNYYWNNQWAHNGPTLGLGDSRYRALHLLLDDVWQRYGKPIAITETSAEGEAGPGWLAHVMAEVRQAERLGVPVQGVCIFPVMDYAGWDDYRHCPVGLIQLDPEMQQRTLRQSMAAELRQQQQLRLLPQ